MARKQVPLGAQTNVLVKSRRRCCICFGLDRDTSLKSGQIAHIDKDCHNNSEDNLCFLCLNHHDEYDSKSSQRKNSTELEVKVLRDELYAHVDKAFSVTVHFGHITVPPADPYAGQYIRIGNPEASAEIILTPLPDDMEGKAQYHIMGFALWGVSREFGPNIGELNLIGALWEPNLIENYPTSDGHRITLRFDGDHLVVEEEDWHCLYGHNVNFIGTYKKGGAF